MQLQKEMEAGSSCFIVFLLKFLHHAIVKTLRCVVVSIARLTVLVSGLRAEDVQPGTVEEAYAASVLDIGTFTTTVGAAVGYALLVAAVGLAVLRSGQMAWFGGLSIVLVIGLLFPFGFAFYALFAFIPWVLFVVYLSWARSAQSVWPVAPATV